MTRRALLVLLVLAGLGGGSLAFASTLNGVTAHSLTFFSASSTVPTQSCSSGPTADTYVDGTNAKGMKTNYGGASTMAVVSGSKPQYALVAFNPCASANAKILSATMQLYLGSSPGSETHTAYAITSGWSENTVTWNTAPTLGSSVASATTGGNGSWTSWNLTSAVQSIVNGGSNNGWEIQDGSGAY